MDWDLIRWRNFASEAKHARAKALLRIQDRGLGTTARKQQFTWQSLWIRRAHVREETLLPLLYRYVANIRRHAECHRTRMIIPGSVREHVHQAETDLYLTHGKRFHESVDPHGWISLVKMHANGQPTRLIEWTRCPWPKGEVGTEDLKVMMAGFSDIQCQSIWFLDPILLNVTTCGQPRVLTSEFLGSRPSKKVTLSYSELLGNRCWDYDGPVAVNLMPEADAILGGGPGSLYTVHGEKSQPIEEQCPECVFSVPTQM